MTRDTGREREEKEREREREIAEKREREREREKTGEGASRAADVHAHHASIPGCKDDKACATGNETDLVPWPPRR